MKPPALFACESGHVITAASHDGRQLTGGFYDLTATPCPACYHAGNVGPSYMLKAWERPSIIPAPSNHKTVRLEIQYPGEILSYASMLPPRTEQDRAKMPLQGDRLPGGGRIVAVYLVNDASNIPVRLKT